MKNKEIKVHQNTFKFKAIENIAAYFDMRKIDYYVKQKENEEEIITEINITKGPNILLHYYCYLRDHDVTLTATLITGIPDNRRAAVLEACNDVQNGFCPFTFYIDFDNNLNMNYEFLFAFPKESIGNIAFELRSIASSILYQLYPDLMEALNNDDYKSAGLDETLRSIRAITKKIREKETE